MKKVLGKIGIIVLLMGMILLCGGCSKGRTVSAPSTNIENVENIAFPEAGWVTAL